MVRLLPLLLVGAPASPPPTARPADDTASSARTHRAARVRAPLDLDASSCEDEDAIVYFLFNGAIDADGNLTGEEGWYWFLKKRAGKATARTRSRSRRRG